MSKLKSILPYVSYVVFTIIVIGVGLAAYGGYNYYTASKRISEIEDEQQKIADIIAGIDTSTTDVTSIGLSGMKLSRERNDEIEVQNEGRRMAGIGIAMIAVGWLVWDVTKSTRRRTELLPAENDSPSSV